MHFWKVKVENFSGKSLQGRYARHYTWHYTEESLQGLLSLDYSVKGEIRDSDSKSGDLKPNLTEKNQVTILSLVKTLETIKLEPTKHAISFTKDSFIRWTVSNTAREKKSGKWQSLNLKPKLEEPQLFYTLEEKGCLAWWKCSRVSLLNVSIYF